VCTAALQKLIKTPYFGSSGSFKDIDVDTTEKLVTIVLVVIGSMPMPISNNGNGKITTFRGYRF